MTYHCDVLRHLQDRTKGFVRRIQRTSNTWEADIEFNNIKDVDTPRCGTGLSQTVSQTE